VVAGPLAARAIDVGLTVEVEMLHHDRRTPAVVDRLLQRRCAQAVVLGVVVHFAEQRQRRARQLRDPAAASALRLRAADAGEAACAGQRHAQHVAPAHRCIELAIAETHAWIVGRGRGPCRCGHTHAPHE
jgi:hypothetical protein